MYASYVITKKRGCKMIIGITGLSGTGKTTLSDKLGKNLNDAKVVHIDNIHIGLLESNPKIVMDIYGSDIIKDGKFNYDLFIKYPDKLGKTFEVSYKDLLNKLYKEIIDAKENNKWIIFDFFALPKIEEIWELCDYTILVKSKSEIKRIQNISLRHIRKGRNPNINIKARDAFAPNYDLYKYDFCISNNYDANFNKDINDIANQLLVKQN